MIDKYKYIYVSIYECKWHRTVLSAACIYIKRIFIIVIRCVFYMCAKIPFINRYITLLTSNER